MRVLLCHRGYKRITALLEELLPDDEVVECGRDEIAREAQESDVIVPIVAPLPAEVYASKRVKLIQQYGVGLDPVDIPAATAAGIPVANIPSGGTGNAESVAELTFVLMLMLARSIPEALQRFQEGQLGATMGRTIEGSTVTILGYGDIGQEVARRLAGWRARVIAVSRYGPSGSRPRDPAIPLDLHVDQSKAGDAVSEADFIVVGAPATPENYGLVGTELFARMKPSAFIVNIARGPVIDYDALLAALRDGQIAGAGLDVYWTEPYPPDDPLFQYNVITTPHIGGGTDLSLRGIATAFAAQVDRLRRGEPLIPGLAGNECSHRRIYCRQVMAGRRSLW